MISSDSTHASLQPAKREDRRVRRTKKLLTQALTQLLQQKAVKDITVKELTDLADMNRGTFYLYYRDVFDMLEQIENELFETFDNIVLSHDKESVIGQSKPMMLDLFSFIEDNQEMCRVLLGPNGDMMFFQRMNEVIRDKCRKDWLSLREPQQEGEFDYHYSFVISGCLGLIRAWVSRFCSEPAIRMAEMADTLIRRGVLVDPAQA
ncbi:MAG: TetR family transcriptional regulator C-terminal domain-containing protein [Clostridia bacterium]|nr:TetR family transcriptional regulator C-terminal domain-containing protein [Clostridia bacterium]